jgi:ribonuclease-3
LKLSADLKAFSRRIGHDFKDHELLISALTHPSMSRTGRADNQRLEFLGDRVLGLIMAETLLLADTDASEGVLAPRFNALVRRETCAEVARRIDLGRVLRLGRSEAMTGGRRKQALLADAMEAVIAAVYLDGGFDAAKLVVRRLWDDHVTAVEEDARDAKTALQELLQARGAPPPDYVEVARTGPDHAPIFTIEVRAQDGTSASASALSKRQAEQQAAAHLLEIMERENGDV